MKVRRRHVRLHTTIAWFVCIVVVLSIAVTGIFVGAKQASNTRQEIAKRAMDVAHMVADSPVVADALEGKQSVAAVEAFTSKLQHDTNVRFIVVMDMNHIRLTHPDVDKIGKHFVGGDENPAIRGETYTSIATGTLGESLRAFVPVHNGNGVQVGVVSVGIMLNHVNEMVARSVDYTYLGCGVGIVIGIIGALLLARKIKRDLLGLEPYEIANLVQERNAMLESVREGIIAVDTSGSVLIANAEAVRIFQRAGLDAHPVGKDVTEYLPGGFGKALQKGMAEYDHEINVNGVILVMNRVPIRIQHKLVGAVATFRDKTELKQLAEQLTGVKLYAEALRAQTHEFMNKLHVILGMVHIGRYSQLEEYVHQITKSYQLEVGSVSRLVQDPVFAGFLISKLSYAREHNVRLNIQGAGPLPPCSHVERTDALITVFGNLLTNAFEAVECVADKEINVAICYQAGLLTLAVSNNGGAIPASDQARIFEHGYSTKGGGRGYGLYLVIQRLRELQGTIQLDTHGETTTFTVTFPYTEGESVDSCANY